MDMEQHKMGFAIIEFPGVINNSENAVRMLGGMDAISSSIVGTRPLELRFQPDNPYLSALVAERQNMAELSSGRINLVMRVRRKKSDPNASCTVECLGVVSTRFHFKSIYDFQYLPLRRRGENLYEDLMPRLVPTDFTSALSWWESADDENAAKETPYFLPPYLFSRYNTQSNKMLGPEQLSQEKRDSSMAADHGRNLRSERKALTVTVNATDPFPEAPSQVAVDDVDMRFKNEEIHRKVKELFDERPMWTKPAVLQKTGFDINTLKVLMSKYAFYIASGPWGRLWCRFGYDPRKDQDAKKYQTVVVSFRHSRIIPEKQRLKVVGGETSASGLCEVVKVDDTERRNSYDYRTGQLPPVRQMWYCVCDIHLPEAQKVIRRDFLSVLQRCNEVREVKEVINSIRNAVKEDVRKYSVQLEGGDESPDEEENNEELEEEIMEDDSNSSVEDLNISDEGDLSDLDL